MLTLSGDGCAIHVETEGAGFPLVLISGLSGTAEFWDPLRPLLKDRHRLILFDHAGTGRSGRRTSHSIESLAEDVVAILDQLDIERAHVMGHSTGGAVAQCLALDAPERVERLVISGSWCRPDDRFRLLFQTRLAILEHAGREVFDALGELLVYSPDWVEPKSTDPRERPVATSSEALAARMRMLLAFDRQDDLAAIKIPTLILAAPDDYVVPVRHGRILAECIPGSRLVEFPGGHFFPRTRPEAVAEAVLRFLAEEKRESTMTGGSG